MPNCPHRPTCDGCPLMDVALDEQLSQKRQTVERALSAYPRLSAVEIAATAASPLRVGYRNRARMVVNPQAQSADDVLGFYLAGTRDVLAIDACLVHAPALEAILGELRPLFFGEPVLREHIKYVDLRITAGFGADGEQGILTLAGPTPPEQSDEQDALVDAARRLHQELDARPGVTELGTHLNLSGGPTHAVLGGEQLEVAGLSTLGFQISERRFDVPPQAFFQVNPLQLDAVHRSMEAHLAEGPELLVDLFCGVGVHGIALAGPNTQLLGVESSEAAVEWARQNAERAGVSAEFFTGDDADSTDWLAELLGDQDYQLVTNPARAGMSPQIVDLIARTRPSRLMYLSCEPRTLARDLDRLCARGFEVVTIDPFDFMPQTDKVETLVIAEPAADSSTDRRTHQRAHWPTEGRHFSVGVSGPAELPEPIDSAVWIALVSGRPPKHGFLPKADGLADQQRIQIDRLRNVGPHSVVRLRSATPDDDELRRRLRAWEHPVIGDPDYGDRSLNHLFERDAYLDRMALHCVSVTGAEHRVSAPVPGQFLGLMKLPRKVLERRSSPPR